MRTLADALVVGVALVATWSDLRRGIIPNTLTLPALAAGLFLHAWDIKGIPWGALAAALLAGPPLYLCWLKGWVGGGDVKLAAALAALLGDPLQAALMLWASGLVGGVLVLWTWRSWLPGAVAAALSFPDAPTLRSVWASHPKGTTVPYGVALAAGAVVAAWIA